METLTNLMNYFPIFLDAKNINAIVIGGGDVAARKIELLLKSTHNITIMSADVNESVMRLIKTEKLNWLTHEYKAGCLQHKNLVIAATNNTAINKTIAEEANSLNIFVNVVDQPELCSYITPAIIDRSPMIIAISSSGYAPVLVRMLREQIEKMLPQGYGRLANFSFKFREHVKARVKNIRDRRIFWENTLIGNIGQALLNGHSVKAEQQFIASLKHDVAPPLGEITFIHTLDGNPDKLTLQAHRDMQFADAVFYDEQVNPELIEYIRRDADKFPQSVSSTIMLNFQHALELAEHGQKIIYLLAGNTPLPENEALKQSNVPTKVLTCGQ
jgi:uroporphyrin-III C-methyltransferase/precorrin-2 dehydrogenase/sirohydrochlorin ferrochelatase